MSNETAYWVIVAAAMVDSWVSWCVGHFGWTRWITVPTTAAFCIVLRYLQ